MALLDILCHISFAFTPPGREDHIRTTLEETASPDATPRRGYSPRLARKSPSRGERVTPPR